MKRNQQGGFILLLINVFAAIITIVYLPTLFFHSYYVLEGQSFLVVFSCIRGQMEIGVVGTNEAANQSDLGINTMLYVNSISSDKTRRYFLPGPFYFMRAPHKGGLMGFDLLKLRIGCPAWVLLFLGPIPALAFFARTKWRSHRRKSTGRCINCGYDLQGSVSDKCSECGEQVTNLKLRGQPPAASTLR